MVPKSAATQSTASDDLGADGSTHRSFLAACPRAAPVAGPTVPRHTLKVGAECLNWARSDLCGGRSAMSVPTANEFHAQDLPRPTKQKFSKRAAASDVSGHPRLWGRRGM